MSKAIGIDLGSTMSEVAVIEGNEPVVIVTAEGSRTFPSVVGFDLKTGDRKVGAAARRQALIHPKETVNLIKRFMGRRFDDAEVTEARKHIQYEVVNKNGWPYVKIGNEEYSPQQVSSWILAELKKLAEDYTGETITDAVITVPALFPDAARTATKEAAELAGLNVLRIINEPTAATLASKLEKSGIYMVTDFGGSTLDNSVVDFDKENSTMEILASNGDTFLGGADVDNALAKYIIDEYKSSTTIDLSKDSMAMQRVMEAVEKAKIELSTSSQTDINLPYITVLDNVPQHLTQTISKAKFEQLIAPIVDKVINSAKAAVVAAKEKNSFDNLDGIILVGGSCRIPYVQQRLESEVGAQLYKKADLDLAVAQGASIQANILSGNTSSTDILLLDVTPLSLGIETLGGVMTKLVDANTTIPARKSEVFSTAVDNQSAVTIQVLQGERKMAKDNKILGTFNLDGIMPAPRGIPQIEVTFDIDANGIVTVSAKDKATGKDQHITIQNSAGLSKEEIERIKAEAEAHKAEDEQKEKDIQTLNHAESYVYNLEDSIKKAGEKISEDDKKTVEPLIQKLKTIIEEKNAGAVDSAMKELQEAFNPIAMKMYQSGNTATGDGTTQNTGNDAFNGFNAEDVLKGFGGFANGGANTTSDSKTSNDSASEADFEEVK